MRKRNKIKLISYTLKLFLVYSFLNIFEVNLWQREPQSRSPLLAVVRTTKLGSRHCTNTPSSSHAFLSLDRALQTGTPVWLLRETQVNERIRRLAAVVLSLFSRCETRQHCTQGRNHFYVVNVAYELKLATLLKWAACELSLKHYFSIIIRGISVIIAGGKRKVARAVLCGVAAH